MMALRVADLTALASVLQQSGGRIDYIAGGTDLIIERQGTPWANLIVDISQTVGLDRIEADAGFLRIGAGVTIARLIEDPLIGQTAPMLARAAAQFGSAQIRNRATLGGNIAGAMPAADLLPVLKCHAVKVEIQRRSGVREVLDFDAVVLGRGQTCLGNGDLILAVHLPLAEATGRISAFVKLGPRQAVTIACLNLAALADYGMASNRLRDVRIVAGALAPVPLRLEAVEAVLRDRPVDQALVADFLHALGQTVDSAIPGRASQPYKRQAILGLGLDLLGDLFGRVFDCPIGMGQSA